MVHDVEVRTFQIEHLARNLQRTAFASGHRASPWRGRRISGRRRGHLFDERVFLWPAAVDNHRSPRSKPLSWTGSCWRARYRPVRNVGSSQSRDQSARGLKPSPRRIAAATHPAEGSALRNVGTREMLLALVQHRGSAQMKVAKIALAAAFIFGSIAAATAQGGGGGGGGAGGGGGRRRWRCRRGCRWRRRGRCRRRRLGWRRRRRRLSGGSYRSGCLEQPAFGEPRSNHE
ncbi:hypothetical protein ACVMB0_007271 [Bradyrhizobium sp. USDA 4451]